MNSGTKAEWLRRDYTLKLILRVLLYILNYMRIKRSIENDHRGYRGDQEVWAMKQLIKELERDLESRS